jgi:glycerol kinase
MSHYLGALDQGTSSTRFVVFDQAGRPIAIDQREHRQVYPGTFDWLEP